ncbi:hypothetical protein MVEN_01087900 [Mycena venus]|uniref:Dystroglycan-type cadherin-like domain-containing protein n=1 Tax=Mycena venus TaxID=2733690 RepID=A0A8H7CZU4_9AGAR|nr:hypothetical protein MVEN_01087900 [Mycena venus]
MLFFNQICFLFLFYFQQAVALAFAPIVGPYVTGAQVPIEWTLDGSEPANGWELWFASGGSAIKLLNVPPLTVSTVVPFPGSNGTFRGLSGTVILATSNEVDLATSPVSPTATSTFSASVISGSGSVISSNTVGPTTSPSPFQSSAAESAAPSRSSAFQTDAVLGMVVGTLAVITVIVLGSVFLYVHRRRRAAAASNAYPFDASDVEKQLARRITPFDVQAGPPPQESSFPPPPPRMSSLPQPPLLSLSLPPLPTAASSAGDLRRLAYLNSQLQKLEVAQPNTSSRESGSIVFGPLSSVPSETMPRVYDREAEPPPTSPPLPPIPESNSRRTAYLAEQLQRLEVPERRPSDGSVVFGPLSSVPSESTAMPYAPSVSTVINSPIQFLRHTSSHMTSPLSPRGRVAPW